MKVDFGKVDERDESPTLSDRGDASPSAGRSRLPPAQKEVAGYRGKS